MKKQKFSETQILKALKEYEVDIPVKQTPQDRFKLTPHFHVPFLV